MMVTTREEMTSSHQSSMLLKKPLLYRGPSTLLLIGVVRPIVKRQFTNPAASADIGSGALSGQTARVEFQVND